VLATRRAVRLLRPTMLLPGESSASLEVSATPHASSGGPGAERHPTLALSINAACVVLRDGTVRCWGSNSDGQLGNPAFMSAAHPTVLLTYRYLARSLVDGSPAAESMFDEMWVAERESLTAFE